MEANEPVTEAVRELGDVGEKGRGKKAAPPAELAESSEKGKKAKKVLKWIDELEDATLHPCYIENESSPFVDIERLVLVHSVELDANEQQAKKTKGNARHELDLAKRHSVQLG